MKRLVLIVGLIIACATVSAQKPSAPVMLSVGDIVSNYGLDSAWVNDTVNVMAYLDSQPQDYVSLTNLCVSIRTKAQNALHSIQNDYDHRDDLVWIDSSTVLTDFAIYEYRLRRLANLMGRMSIHYSRLEQKRIEAEKEAARQRAIEEARRQQDERDKTASDLRANIDLHHRAIIKACDGVGISDKAKLKELKDLYYSYLMVYNKYDLSTYHATPESIVKLDELNSFQNDLLEKVLGNNSLPYQIENFKNVLKMRCEKENGDVYRSYTRVFKHTTVPVSFADIKEYEDYINRMHTVIAVQRRYLHTLDLRATIAAGTDAILQLYGKKFRDVASAYKDVLRTINQLPAFTTNAESINFIRQLDDFIAAQQMYIDDYALYAEIAARADSIVKGTRGHFSDVVASYRSIEPTLTPLPAFKDVQGGEYFEHQLAEVQQVQQCYLEVIALRQTIEALDDSISSNKRVDRTLSNGYRLLRRQAELKPSFSTVERGRSFIAYLQDHIEMQQLCMQIIAKLETINQTDRRITSKDQPFRNLAKAYQRLLKAYEGVSEVANREDLMRYDRQCDRIEEMQQAFIKMMNSELAAETDNRLHRETDVERIKIAIGLN